MGARPGEGIGVIYGQVEATEFTFAANQTVKRLDYVSAEHPDGLALGQVIDIQRHSQLSFEEAVAMPRGGGNVVAGDYVSCKVRIVGIRDERGLLQTPRTPFKAGTEVRRATANLIQKVLGLTSDPDRGAYIGFLKGTESPVVLDINSLVQKHVSVLAKTGAGKSYTVGVLIEELLKRRVPLVIIDAHGEYTTLGSPNIEPSEIDKLIRFNLKPKSFHGSILEYAMEKPSAGRKRLELQGTGLDAREILDVLPSKLSPAQTGLLYQAVNDLRRTRQDYSFREVIDEVSKNPSNAKWPLVGALETLESTGLFSAKGTPLDQLVMPGQASIINLKGTSPEVQQVAVARLASGLFEARKKGQIPAFMFVVEEAHNYCPQGGVAGAALSLAILRKISQEGRKFGMGLLVVSQRPALVDKTVLGQCNTQFIMKVTNPNDLKAISASVEGLTSEAAEEIQRLDIGVALVTGSSLTQPILVEIRTRQTRHGGRSVDVLRDEESEGMEPEPQPRELPPPPIEVAALPPAEHVLREAKVAEPEVAERPLETPRPVGHHPWAPADEREPPLVDGELDDEATPPRHAPAAPKPSKSKRAKAPLPEFAAPQEPSEDDQPLSGSMEPEDVLVNRVIGRIGFNAHSPREAVQKVKELAKNLPEMSPEDYVHGFARIGRNFCYPAHPECGPCPLLRTCRLGLERLGRGEVREGRWGRSAG